jgi:hypothetical protein
MSRHPIAGSLDSTGVMRSRGSKRSAASASPSLNRCAYTSSVTLALACPATLETRRTGDGVVPKVVQAQRVAEPGTLPRRQELAPCPIRRTLRVAGRVREDEVLALLEARTRLLLDEDAARRAEHRHGALAGLRLRDPHRRDYRRGVGRRARELGIDTNPPPRRLSLTPTQPKQRVIYPPSTRRGWDERNRRDSVHIVLPKVPAQPQTL